MSGVTEIKTSTGLEAGTAASPWVVSNAAGTAIIGKVSIDQTTPGTTNGVALTQEAVAAPIVFQYKVTASAVQQATHALVNGVTVKAKGTNAATVFVGLTGVTTTYDGTGNGFPLEPGDTVSLPIDNTNRLYVIGTANDVISFVGN